MPARGVWLSDLESFGVRNGGCEAAGEEARRAVKAARETELVVGGVAWLGVGGVDESGTGRGRDGEDSFR
jgi:hypothetical protein